VRAKTEAERMEATFGADWLTPAQCGQAAGMGASSILRDIDAGLLRARDVSRPGAKRRTLKVRREWLEAYMAAQEVGAEDAA
jgi:hypothetical protein